MLHLEMFSNKTTNIDTITKQHKENRMQLACYLDDTHSRRKFIEVCRNEAKISNLYLVRVGIFVVSLEILKPERKLNHERSSKSS